MTWDTGGSAAGWAWPVYEPPLGPPFPPPEGEPEPTPGEGEPEPQPEPTPEPEPKPGRSGGARYQRKEGNQLFQDYDSVNDVLAHLEKSRSDGANDSSTRREPTDTWDLGIGYDGALDAYTGGWSEGAQKAYDLAERLSPRPIDKRTTFTRDVVGAFPNVGAYLAGAPNAMHRVSRKQAKSRPYVHLYCPIVISNRVNAENAFNRGCAMVALADALESAGCRVRITLVSVTHVDRNGRLTMRFLVKDYGDRMDIDSIMFATAHPAMLRRIGLGLMERSKFRSVLSRTQKGYGMPGQVIPSVDTEQDGRAVIAVLPNMREWGDSTPEGYLTEMVASLPDEIRTEIEPQ